jgi:hypothetical protein
LQTPAQQLNLNNYLDVLIEAINHPKPRLPQPTG